MKLTGFEKGVTPIENQSSTLT